MLKKVVVVALTTCLLGACLAGCAPARKSSEKNPVPVSGEKYIFYGDDTGEALHNPLMGWQYYAFPWEVIRYGIPDEFDIGVIKCSWDQIEKEQGVYDFDLLDRAVKRLKQDGKTVYLRLYLMPDNVWEIDGYPAWVKNVPDVGEFKEVELEVMSGSKYTFSHPPYASDVYQGLVKTFLEKVSEHYEDGFVDVIDSRAYGLYGEWDSNWGNYWITDPEDPDYDPDYKTKKMEVLNDFVNLYKDAFSEYSLTKIAINVSAETFDTQEERVAYIHEAALDSALSSGFIVRFDGTGSNFSDKLVLNDILAEYYPEAPVFSETYFGWDTNFNVEATYDAFTAARSNGATYGFYKGNWQEAVSYNPDFFENGLKPNSDGKQIGYRIYPSKIEFNKEANAGGKIHFSSVWKNTGAGVLYRHYPLGVSLVDKEGNEVYFAIREDFNLTKQLKESEDYVYSTSFNLPKEDVLPKGEYTLRVALVDPNNNNKSAIAMPLSKKSADSLDYEIGKITIK